MHPIIDLHCDLIGCLAMNPQLNFESEATRCSLSQLYSGGVLAQVFAMSSTSYQKDLGKKQIELYQELLKDERIESFKAFSHESTNLEEDLHARAKVFKENPSSTKRPPILALIAIENASTFLPEQGSLNPLYQAIESLECLEKILYISFTWNHENRLGGGNESPVGIKPDGIELLHFLNGRSIACDLSHTSDALAHDILNTIEQKSFQIPVIASHSNYRARANIKRNLPDEIAKEIFKRKGLIGLNLLRRFLGGSHPTSPELILDHLQHALELGGKNSLAMGSDFYGGIHLSQQECPGRILPSFFPKYDHAGQFQNILRLIHQTNSSIISLEKDVFLQKIAFENAISFFSNHLSYNSP